ncbi:MAC/Perforin domain protein [Chlamydia ibidis]|uniref:MAC/Perforin domain protein n=2 Tax=Chlamydia ibidis TaxID=1405396 RepID=S7KGK4_9CHLA|nr:MAC/perforin domain-containing protein [Chlamydia ibidis]EPP35286.1 MAC/Perforin domain protein [Chlamydia ibidis]EQM62655.1 MAC/Perforin domain protein [Chlamydia ibidis 10-1398/6]
MSDNAIHNNSMPNALNYVSIPYDTFDLRLDSQALLEEFSSIVSSPFPIDAENDLEMFINNLQAHDFSSATSDINTSSSEYQLYCKGTHEKGTFYEIIEPKILGCVASCIVDSVLSGHPYPDTLLEEIKSSLLLSSQNGVQFLITREDNLLQNTPLIQSDSYELVRNVSFLGRALDIVTLDPVNILNSLRNINILDYSFTEETAIPSSDAHLGIPPGTKLFPKPSLDVSVSTSIFEEKTSFSKEFSTTVTINVPYFLPNISLSLGSSNLPNTSFGDAQTEIFVTKKQLFPSYSPKLLDIIKKYKRDAKILINKITFKNLWRNQAKSQILTQGDVRLDLQGMDSTNFNYQIQVGSHTISAVLISKQVSEIRSSSEQTYAIRKIKSGFQKSLDDCHIYQISLKKPPHLSDTPLSLGSVNDDEEEHSLAEDAAFSASFTYSFVKQNTQHSKNTVTCTTASHSLYTLQQDRASDPANLKIDKEFQQIIETLNTKDPKHIEAFISNVGTHYTTSVTYGGVGFQVLKISFEQIEKLEQEKISISTAAASSLLKGSVTNKTESGYSSLILTSSAQTVFLGGTVLPTMQEDHLDFKDWSESVPLDPIPIQIAVSPITDILIPQHFPTIEVASLEEKKQAIQTAVNAYLRKHKPGLAKLYEEFTSGIALRSSQFILRSGNSSSIVSAPYLGYWSTLPYLFPTIEEESAAVPLVFYFQVENDRIQQKIVHNTFCNIGVVDVRKGLYRSNFVDYAFIAFYGSWQEAYLDTSYYTDRCGFEIEKVNRSKDNIIRAGDEVRLKHTASNKYLSNISMRDGHNTLTRTDSPNDAIFILEKPKH